MANLDPCISYKDTLDVTTMDKAKMERANADGQMIRREVPIFEAKHGVEGLFHVIDTFTQVADELDLPIGERWTQFPRALNRVAQAKWTNLTRNIAPNQKTVARFNLEQQRLLTKHAEHEDPGDVLLEYLRSDRCHKLRSVSVGDHVSRIETLCDFANRLAGTEPELTEDQIKKIAFNSFPDDWKSTFLLHNRLTENTLDEVVEFMSRMKQTADNSEKQRKRKRDELERLRGGGNGGDKKNKGTSDKKRDRPKRAKNGEAICPEHPHGTHSWSECSKNPASANYGRYGGGGRGNNGHNGGRGGGGGRGFGGSGRGNGGRGYPGNGGFGSGEHHHHEHKNGQHDGPPAGTPVDHFHFQHGPRGYEGSWGNAPWFGDRSAGHHHPHNNNNNNYGYGW